MPSSVLCIQAKYFKLTAFTHLQKLNPKRALILYAYINSLLPLEVFIAPIVVLFYMKYLGLTFYQYSFFISLIFIINAILEVPLGFVSDLIGRMKSILFGKAIYLFSLVVLVEYGTEINVYYLALPLSIGGALASGNLEVAIYNTHASDKGASAQKILTNVGALSIAVSSLGAIVGGYVALNGLQIPMYLDIAALTVNLAAFIFLITPLGEHPFDDTEVNKKINNKFIISRFINSINDKKLLFIASIISILSFALLRTSLNFYQPILVNLDWSTSHIGWLFGISILISALLATKIGSILAPRFWENSGAFTFSCALIITGILYIFSDYSIIFFLIAFTIHQIIRVVIPPATAIMVQNSVSKGFKYRTTILSVVFVGRSIFASFFIFASASILDKGISYIYTLSYTHLLVFVFSVPVIAISIIRSRYD